MKEFVSKTMVVMEMGKRRFLSYHNNTCYKEEKLCQRLESYRFKLPLQNWINWISAGWDKISQPQKCKFLEKGRERQKQAILLFLASFHNFALKTETGCATRVVNLILKIINVINRC